MKNRRLWLVVLSLIFSICMCFCFAACGDDDVTTPGNGGNVDNIGNVGGSEEENPNGEENGGQNTPAVLAVPVVTIDDNGKASWSEVANASGYAFIIDDGAEQTATKREVQLEDGQAIAVKAKGDGVNYTDSNWSASKTYTAPAVVAPVKLGTPAVTLYEDGTARWQAVANASSYVVKIGDTQTETSATTKKLSNNQTISVQAVGNGTTYLSSDFSAPKTYKAPSGKLDAPENLKVEIQGIDAGKVVLSWNEVTGAGGYEYVVNDTEQTTVAVYENSVTVDLTLIDASLLDYEWTFKVKSLSRNGQEIAEDGDYSAYGASSDYCNEVTFSISDEETYTVAEIIKISNYYGDRLPYFRYFVVEGTIASNANGNAVLENGFTLFGKGIQELDIASTDSLSGYTVMAEGTLTNVKGVKGLTIYYAPLFDLDNDGLFKLAKATLNGWDKIAANSRLMGDLYLPLNLFGVDLLWTVVDDGAGAFDFNETNGHVSINCPYGSEDVIVKLSLIMGINNDDMYGDEIPYIFYVAPDTREQLRTPSIKINATTGIATWAEVEHAVRYKYRLHGVINDDYSNWETNNVDIEGYIEIGEPREVQMYNKLHLLVWAIGDDKKYIDSEPDEKRYNYHPETVDPDGTPLVFDITKLTQTGELANPTYIFGLACARSPIFQSASASKVELGNKDGNGVMTGTGFIKVGSASNNGTITLNFTKKIKGVKITARQWNKDQSDKISVNGSAEQTASKNDWGTMTFNFAPTAASTKVEITTNNRVFIQSITVYFED